MQRELHHNIRVSAGLAPVLLNSDTTTAGEVVDRQGFESVEFVLQAGVLTDGSYTLALAEADSIDESGDLVSENVVAAADLLGDLPVVQNDGDGVDDSGLAKKVGYRGGKRYLRADVVSADTDDGGLIGLLVIQGNPRNAPVE